MARVEACNRADLPLLSLVPFFPFLLLSLLRPETEHSRTNARYSQRVSRWSNTTRPSSDHRLFSLPILSLSFSLSLVTRNRSRLIVKKKEKKESLVSVDTRLLLRSSSVRVRLSVKNKATTAAPELMMIFLSPLVPSYALLSLKSMDARCSWRLVEWFFFLLFFFSTIPGERKRI